MADNAAASFDLTSVLPNVATMFSGAASFPDAAPASTAIPLKASTLYKNSGVYNGALIFWVSLGQQNPVPPGGLTVTDYAWELLAL